MPLSQTGILIFVGGSSCVTTVSFKMEKDWIAPRECHEKSGRLVRIDKFHTVESKKEKARVATAEWKKRNPRAR